ncbi:baculoviral IAP repeat-containing protein 7-like isoform X1 [Leptotrombidium deliense]|uniref:Baculoviral IAP repeat-containing protein 7-like isoform X1 n=1 Tax=Leptotrombidium deliense TaxID=299467 RepID=A0A443QU11_9ACAR|nr:baculoviral IAP repeat-containing protein 7-like isoform X1 [Leptotrombidium deliense]
MQFKLFIGPLFTAFESYESRLNSFQYWPLPTWIKPETLANAGFFYTGIADCVKCYYCMGQLCFWQPDDDPWIKHAQWYPACGFVMSRKGYASVEACSQTERISSASSEDEVAHNSMTSEIATKESASSKIDYRRQHYRKFWL